MNGVRILIVAAALACCAPAIACIQASVDQLGWISGTWRGELFGAQAEEIWSEPAGGHMIGAFRLYGDEGPRVFEFFSISDDAESGHVMLRFKHLTPAGLEPWEKEAPLEFGLVSLEGQRAEFLAMSEEQTSVRKMTFVREGDDLKVIVEGEHENGESFEFTAAYTLYGK